MKKLLSLSGFTALALALAVTGCSSTSNSSSSAQDTENTTETATSSVETSSVSNESAQANQNEAVDLPQLGGVKSGDTIATIKTNMGDIKVWFFPEYAPKAVENFTTHAKEGYYNNLIFHRVINEFMIQGGDPLGTGTGGESIWGEDFEIETSPNLRNFRGALCMANTGQPNSNSSQFYIVQANDAKTQLDQLKQSADESVFSQVYPENVVKAYEELGGTPSLDVGCSPTGYSVFGQVYEGMDVVDKIAAVETNENDKPTSDVVIESIEVGTY